MTGEERIRLTMNHQKADRVPVFCQLSLGHYKINSSLEEVDPYDLFYIKPHDITGINHPYYYGLSKQRGFYNRNFFPNYLMDTLKYLLEIAGDYYHIPSEVFSPFTQLMELFDYSNALIALMDDLQKCERILENLSQGTAGLAVLEASIGVDAMLVSWAFAGGGFISKAFYEQFVLPYEKNIVDRIHKETDIPIYVHTCGAIGDRIDLMVKAGYDGIDTMDPPPLHHRKILCNFQRQVWIIHTNDKEKGAFL